MEWIKAENLMLSSGRAGAVMVCETLHKVKVLTCDKWLLTEADGEAAEESPLVPEAFSADLALGSIFQGERRGRSFFCFVLVAYFSTCIRCT